MLPAQFRLRERKDFTRVLRSGKSLSLPLCVVRWSPSHLQNPRFGFIVSNKISKKAVIRNKIKRRLREAVRARVQEFLPGVDYIFISKSSFVKADMASVREMIDGFLAKTGIKKIRA